jgi:hypothetical protein
VRLGHILEEAGVSPQAVKVAFYASDNFTTDLTVTTAMRHDIILAYERDGEPLTENLRLVVPCKWGYKWIRDLIHIELVDYDFLGTLESQGYSDEANIPGDIDCDGVTCDDSDGDGVCDDEDNCPSVATPWFVPAGDSDCDGFTDGDEGVIGTDPNVACGTACWPPDFDDNQVVNILDVNEVLPPYFGLTSFSPGWDARYDLKVDGVINILDVNMTLPPFFGYVCT